MQGGLSTWEEMWGSVEGWRNGKEGSVRATEVDNWVSEYGCVRWNESGLVVSACAGNRC